MTKSKHSTHKTARVLLIVLPIALFVLIAFSLYADIATGFESWVYAESTEHMSPLLTSCVKAITHLGDTITVLLVCLVLFVVPPLRRNYALPVALSTIVAAILNIVLKQMFARQRPDILALVTETSYSFPSGHAMISMAMYGAIVFLAWRYMRSLQAKILTTVIFAVLVAAIGFSRVYLGVHYATDVVAGWCLGLAIALGVVFLFDGTRKKKKANNTS